MTERRTWLSSRMDGSTLTLYQGTTDERVWRSQTEEEVDALGRRIVAGSRLVVVRIRCRVVVRLRRVVVVRLGRVNFAAAAAVAAIVVIAMLIAAAITIAAAVVVVGVRRSDA